VTKTERPVEVLVAGEWFRGTLDRWKHDHRGWVGHVWWSRGPGLNYVEWIPTGRLRPRADDDGDTFPTTPETQARLEQIHRDYMAGRAAGDPLADMDLGGR